MRRALELLARPHRLGGVDRQFGPYAVPAVLVLFFVTFSLVLPGTFFTFGNINAMITAQAVLLILALGLTVPLRVGAFDLSIANVANLSAAIVAVLTVQHGVNGPVAILLALAVAVGIGALNGFFIVVVGLDAFITTLGTMTLIGGLTYGVTGSETIAGLPAGVLAFARTDLFGLPLAAYYGWFLALLLWVIYEYTPFGRYLLFIGGNSDASRLVGLRVSAIRFASFVLSALFAGFAGVVLVGTIGAVDPSVGPQYLLPPFAAAFLGTAAIQLGRFNVIGTMVGLYLLIIGTTGLELMGVASWVSDAFNGAALVAAILFARLLQRRSRP